MGEIIVDNSGFVQTRYEIRPDGTFSVQRTQDVEKILENNKNLQNDSNFLNGYTPSGDLKHVASIPLIVLEQWAKKYGIPARDMFGAKMTEIIRKELNSPDNRFLRTGQGRI